MWTFLCVAAPARADKSGVTPNKLNLPAGPGSLEGIGENAEPDLNMGLVNYGVPLATPQGYSAGMSPQLRLAYSSGSGQSVVGLGWSLGTPSIERMTAKGLPRYDASDRFSAGGELVRLPGSNVYRSRFEGKFARTTWVDAAGQGKTGYWKEEHPDGRVSYYGATAAGVVVALALEQGAAGVFRYHLVETVDAFGHVVRYDYVKDGAVSLPSRITYVFDTAGRPRHEIALTYQVREDHQSDAKPGFELRLTSRLHDLTIKSHGVQRNRYEMIYESYTATRGQTRLAAVYTFGRGDAGPYPIRFRFAYTGSPLAQCITRDCRLPYVATLGSLGLDLRAGDADLIDMNGDALPDVVETTDQGHFFHLNTRTPTTHVLAAPVSSSAPFGLSARLSSPQVDMLDIDGDGFSDMIDGANSRVLWNRGAGDWVAQSALPLNLPNLAADADLRFFDFDNDRVTDLIHSDGASTWYILGRGDGSYDTSATFADNVGWGFVRDDLRLADMNGDGLQDAVIYVPGSGLLAYRMNLGRGRMSAMVEMVGLPVNLPPDFAHIDLNGDGLSDVVAALGVEVLYALNQNGTSFEPLSTIDSSMLENGTIPERTAAVSIRYADMNGSGSTDVVWVDASGRVDYLELFPMRPNLLNRITNNIGKNIELTYGSSTDHMARDGGPSAWSDRLPNPTLTLDNLSHYETLSQVRQVKEVRYHDGFYDGVEKLFRGFARVEVLSPGDGTMEPGRVEHHFDVGKSDPYYAGRPIRVLTESGGRVIKEVATLYDDCAVGGVPAGLAPEVRYVCQVKTHEVIKEGKPEAEWVVQETAFEHDAYGNLTRSINHGITSIGGGACAPCTRPSDVMGAPCGAACLGDEQYEETDYVPPTATGGRWALHAAYRQHGYARPGAEPAETTTYFDGPDFVGLPLGQLTLGYETRSAVKLDAAGQTVDRRRLRRDAHGNEVEARDGAGNRRLYAYDADGHQLLAEEALLDQTTSPPYSLRMEVVRDPVFDEVIESSDWVLYEGGGAVSARRVTSYAYDAFGRTVAVAAPGDTLASPTYEFQIDLGDPVSRIVKRGRVVAGGALELEGITCFDGMGRDYQTRDKVSAGRYRVSGFTVWSAQGQDARVYQTYESINAGCDRQPPGNLAYAESRFDFLGRVLSMTRPDASLFGTPSTVVTDFGPSYSVVYDEYDLDASSPYAGTPLFTRLDGLGRKNFEEKLLAAGGAPVRTEYRYDELGRAHSLIDAAGHVKSQRYSLRGEVTWRDDPDMGIMVDTYDVAGRLATSTDARGVTLRREYDELGRTVRSFSEADPEGSRLAYLYDREPGCQGSLCDNDVGRLVAITFPIPGGQTGRDRFYYDARGQQIRLVRTAGAVSFTFETDFDNTGRAIAQRYPDGRRLDYQLDGQGRLLSVPGVITSVEYGPGGDLSTALFANGVRTTYGYDLLRQHATLVVANAAGAPFISEAYSRDRWGNVLEVEDHLAEPSQPSGNASFVYDALERLAEARLDIGNGYAEILSYDYDLEDNLLAKVSDRGVKSKEHVGVYGYGVTAHAHAAAKAGDTSFAYDANGHMTRRGAETFVWSDRRHLASAHRGARRLATFGYDAADERLTKREGEHLTYYLSPDFEVRDGIATTYVSLDGRRVARLESAALAPWVLSDVAPGSFAAGGSYAAEPDGRITAAEAWIASRLRAGALTATPALDPSPSEQLLAASARRLLASRDGSGAADTVEFFHHDYRASTIATTGAGAEVLQRTAYYPFGVERTLSAGYGEPYGFEGHEKDDSTGASYRGDRYKDLRLALWLSPDWSFFGIDLIRPPGETVYGEKGQNPVSNTAWVGAPPRNLGKSVVPLAQAAVGVRAAPPPPERRPLVLAAAGKPTLASFRVVPSVVKKAEEIRAPAVAVPQQIQPQTTQPTMPVPLMVFNEMRVSNTLTEVKQESPKPQTMTISVFVSDMPSFRLKGGSSTAGPVGDPYTSSNLDNAASTLKQLADATGGKILSATATGITDTQKSAKPVTDNTEVGGKRADNGGGAMENVGIKNVQRTNENSGRPDVRGIMLTVTVECQGPCQGGDGGTGGP